MRGEGAAFLKNDARLTTGEAGEVISDGAAHGHNVGCRRRRRRRSPNRVSLSDASASNVSVSEDLLTLHEMPTR